MILRHATAFVVENCKVVLGQRIALIGREPVPFHGFGVILGDAPAVIIGNTEIELGAQVAFFGERTDQR